MTTVHAAFSCIYVYDYFLTVILSRWAMHAKILKLVIKIWNVSKTKAIDWWNQYCVCYHRHTVKLHIIDVVVRTYCVICGRTCSEFQPLIASTLSYFLHCLFAGYTALDSKQTVHFIQSNDQIKNKDLYAIAKIKIILITSLLHYFFNSYRVFSSSTLQKVFTGFIRYIYNDC